MPDVDVLPAVFRMQPLPQIVAAAAMTHHVAADAHFSARGRLQKKVRIEARDRLKRVERHAQTLAERDQFPFRQIAVRPLNATELVEDW